LSAIIYNLSYDEFLNNRKMRPPVKIMLTDRTD
jgi:hypothetical protein